MKERKNDAQDKEHCTFKRALLAKDAYSDAAGLPAQEEVLSHADGNLLGSFQW